MPGERIGTCTGCGDSISVGEPRWALQEPKQFWHYGCAERAGRARPFYPATRSHSTDAIIVSFARPAARLA